MFQKVLDVCCYCMLVVQNLRMIFGIGLGVASLILQLKLTSFRQKAFFHLRFEGVTHFLFYCPFSYDWMSTV